MDTPKDNSPRPEHILVHLDEERANESDKQSVIQMLSIFQLYLMRGAILASQFPEPTGQDRAIFLHDLTVEETADILDAKADLLLSHGKQLRPRLPFSHIDVGYLGSTQRLRGLFVMTDDRFFETRFLISEQMWEWSFTECVNNKVIPPEVKCTMEQAMKALNWVLLRLKLAKMA